jgi:hypothetical protein
MDFPKNYIEPNILRLAILEMIRMKGNSSFCPSEVVRWIYPNAWEYFMEEVRTEMMQLYRLGEISVTHNGKPLDPGKKPEGSVRISGIKETL